MASFSRLTQRFFYTGLGLNAPGDAEPTGKFPFAQNIRSYQAGTIQPREGLSQIHTVTGVPHCIFRLNDPTPFNGGVPSRHLVGAGNNLYAAQPGTPGAMTLIDTGYSGLPLTALFDTPPQSVQPWCYLADSARMRKVRIDNFVAPIGLAQPSTEPSAEMAQPGLTIISDLNAVGPWTHAGTVAANPTVITRVNTLVNAIVYDVGGTGYASVGCAIMQGLTVGTLVTVGGAETVLVTDVLIAVAPTTVAAIIYDAGVSGLCTIQPTASLGVGQLESPPIAAYRVRPGYAVPRGQAGGIPLEPDLSAPVARIRQVDFPVNSLITIGGEPVRILSVAVGTDGVQSFRCSTSGTHSAGEAIIGIAGFRAFFTTTRSAGDAVTTNALENVLTPVVPAGALVAPMTGGIQATLAADLALVGGRATLQDDYLHLAIRVTRMNEVQTVRLYLDTDAGTPSANTFLQNYYFFEWRASDIVAAIQATNAAAVTPVIDARTTAVTNAQLSGPVTSPGGAVPRGSTGPAPLDPGPGTDSSGTHHTPPGQSFTATVQNPAFDVAVFRNPNVTAAVAAANANSAQLALGNNQWIDLKCRIRDLVQVGTDTTRTLQNVAAVEILVSAVSPIALTVDYDAIWLSGGYGPDVGDIGAPYVFCYRPRSSITGAIGNPSPPSRGGVTPRRQRVVLTGTHFGDSQVDKVDWFSLGGTLTRWTYAGTGDNSSPPTLNYDVTDSAITGGADLSFKNFQPWPTTDLPQTGTCNVAGTAVNRVSGPAFNTAWSPGSAIIINGVVCTLFAPPANGDFLQVNENAGSGAGLSYYMPNPSLLGQPLPTLWGPPHIPELYFACGDPNNPSTVYWTNPGSAETASDANTVVVSLGSDSELLQNGFVFDGTPYVFSTEQLYELQQDPLNPVIFYPFVMPCGRGLWTRWAFAVAPEGVYFVAKDGIFLTTAGSAAKSVTAPDLRPLFPHDGQPGVPVNGIPPPDMSNSTHLRLTYVDGWLYFDYTSLGGQDYTLVVETATGAYYFDVYPFGIRARLSEPGLQIHSALAGDTNGSINTQSGTSDNGTAIAGTFTVPWVDVGDPRLDKTWGDLILDCDPKTIASGISVTPEYNDLSVSLGTTVVGAGLAGRQPFIIDVNSGSGQLARNLAIVVAWSSATVAPIFYLWQPSYIPKVELSVLRATDWDDLGYLGAKFIQGLVLKADTLGINRIIEVEADNNATPLSLTINHNGEQEIAYPEDMHGWTPFIAHTVRLIGLDSGLWRYYTARWVWEPAPELATQWTTQQTSHDLPGYQTVRDLVLAHQSTSDLAFTLLVDGHGLPSLVIPHSNGVYRRAYVTLPPNKGLAVQYTWTSAQPFRLFKRDLSVRVQGWGRPGGYQIMNPFGGPSRQDGAAI